MVQQHVAGAQRCEHVGRCTFAAAQGPVGLGNEAGILQVWSVELGDRPEPGEVERGWAAIDLLLGDLELAHQQVQDSVARRVVDLESHGCPEPAPGQLALEGVQQVACLGVHLEVLVAGDAERGRLQHPHAGEDHVQVGRDHRLERDEARVLLVGGDEARQQRGHLDPREVLVLGRVVADDDGQVERQARDVGERVSRVDGQRGQDGVDALREQRAHQGDLGRLQVLPRDDADAGLGQLRQERLGAQGRLPGDELLGIGRDAVESLLGREARLVAGRDAGSHPPLQRGDAHHEELVEVAGEDRAEAHAFQQWHGGVFGELEHSCVEVEPAGLPAQEPVGWPVGLLRRRVRDRDVDVLDLLGTVVGISRRLGRGLQRPRRGGGGAHDAHAGVRACLTATTGSGPAR